MGMWSLWAATERAALAVDRPERPSAAAMDALRGPFAVLEDALGRISSIGGRFTVADVNAAEVVRCRRRRRALQGSAQTEGLAPSSSGSSRLSQMWDAREKEPARPFEARLPRM